MPSRVPDKFNSNPWCFTECLDLLRIFFFFWNKVNGAKLWDELKDLVDLCQQASRRPGALGVDLTGSEVTSSEGSKATQNTDCSLGPKKTILHPLGQADEWWAHGGERCEWRSERGKETLPVQGASVHGLSSRWNNRMGQAASSPALNCPATQDLPREEN